MKFHNTDQNGGWGAEEEERKKNERKEQFAVNFFGSKWQPNGPENERRDGESAERSFAVMAPWMDGREMCEIINCKTPAHRFPGITAFRTDLHHEERAAI